MGYYSEFAHAENTWFQNWLKMPVLFNIGGSTVLADPSQWDRLTKEGQPIALVGGEPLFFDTVSLGNSHRAGSYLLGDSVESPERLLNRVLEIIHEVGKQQARAAKNSLRMVESFATHGHPNPFPGQEPIRRLTRRGKVLPAKGSKEFGALPESENSFFGLDSDD
jgi:hypothetical protein